MSEKEGEEYDVSVLLLVSDGCPSCSQIKKEMAAEIESGEVDVVDVEKSEVGRRIAELLEIRSIPEFVAVLRKKGDSKMVFCVIGDEEKCVEVVKTEGEG